ncbi:MAG TPA: hypothetical protein PLJ27_10330 [Polyangiaceae bacterium]|nr:MAG: hypothetical protein BWY17_03850 [Deltaproteobacteria bacterium ADurb.Bin207]HNS98819.1 hypothetical protein [Polyangiaceae bacterium]HNZ22114.1 hypothetical protein [Polyangiaceae bacterium]HOD21390.1 hypothetical protein [Polyangiaceae bacterium]HOE46938.1 hypothetical protein [Polyangiaceae bacterium]
MKSSLFTLGSWALLACLWLSACDPPEPPAGEYPAVFRDAAATSDAEAADSGPNSDLVADGTWLLWHETSTCVKALSVDLESVTQTLLLVSLSSDVGGVVHHTSRDCLIEQTPIVGVATTIPLQVVETIPPQNYVAVLSGSHEGATYSTQRIIELWGLHLDDPEFEELPKDPLDSRVYDQDGDGNPGATLVLGANQCSMYVVQRAIAQWNGKVESSIRIAGVGNNATTQVVLGATGGFCASQFDTRNPPDSARFVLQRVDGRYGAPNLDTNGDGQIDCEEVRAYGSEPFGPRQPDNERCKSQP